MSSAAKIAVIAEDSCIGCGKCLPACPIDAIIGAPRYMHTIISQECTGCGLCISPCPVDCISFESVSLPNKEWRMERAFHAKKRVEAKAQRKTEAYYAKRPEAAVLDRVVEAPKIQLMDRRSELLAVIQRKSSSFSAQK